MWLNGIEFIPRIVRRSFHSTVVKNFNYKLANLLKSQQVSLHMCTICWALHFAELMVLVYLDGHFILYAVKRIIKWMKELLSKQCWLRIDFFFKAFECKTMSAHFLLANLTLDLYIHSFGVHKKVGCLAQRVVLSFPWGYLAFSTIPLPRTLVP